MAVDVAPEIYAAIEADFKTGVNTNKGIQRIMRKVIAGKGTQAEMAKLSTMFGKEASMALKAHLLLTDLPNQTLYWNIAERTIQPLLLKAYDNVNHYAALQQLANDRSNRLKLRILTGSNPEARARAVMQMAVDSITQDELNNALTDPTITAVQKYYDDFQRENAQLRAELGLETTVVRVYDGVGLKGGKEPCQWCMDREGVWTYDEAISNGVFERHPGCGCTIEYHTSKGTQRQTDWTTNTWE